MQVRMERAWDNAEKLVKKLKGSGLVRVVYSAPKCAVFSCEAHGGMEGVTTAMSAMHLIKFTPTLGGVTTTLSHPATTSHKIFAVVERRKAGIVDGLIRISVGIEDAEELWADLRKGLLAAQSTAQNGLVKDMSDISLVY
jgi:methionine-gamma-lyase